MGFTVVAIKLGVKGIYLATTDLGPNLAKWRLEPGWQGRELMAPGFRASMVNATGAGDAAIAGFIASVATGSGPEQALVMAAAAGAASVEATDASSGLKSMRELAARVALGWERNDSCAPGRGWTYDPRMGVWNHAQLETLK
jgi:sugar/nucleoside kinase (ribokinase family)